jgi:hypothetical protein
MANIFKKIKERALQSLNNEEDQLWSESEFVELAKISIPPDFDFDDLVFYNIVSETKLDYFYILIAGWLRTLIQLLKRFLSQAVSILLHLSDLLFSKITLLFGLSSSQSSTLFSAFFGTSLSRIPNL